MPSNRGTGDVPQPEGFGMHTFVGPPGIYFADQTCIQPGIVKRDALGNAFQPWHARVVFKLVRRVSSVHTLAPGQNRVVGEELLFAFDRGEDHLLNPMLMESFVENRSVNLRIYEVRRKRGDVTRLEWILAPEHHGPPPVVQITARLIDKA